MPTTEDEDTRVYTVLVNHEGQHSLWLKSETIPNGWQVIGKEGAKAECLQYVKEAWTDMTPLSNRKKTDLVGVSS